MTEQREYLSFDEMLERKKILRKHLFRLLFGLLMVAGMFGFTAYKVEEWYWKLFFGLVGIGLTWLLGRDVAKILQDTRTDQKIVKTGNVVDYAIKWTGSSGHKTRTEELVMNIDGEELRLDANNLRGLKNYAELKPYFNETSVFRAELTPYAGILTKLTLISGEPKERSDWGIRIGIGGINLEKR